MLSNYTQPPEVAVLYTHTHTHTLKMAGWFFSATSVHRTRCDSEERTGGGGFPPSGGSFDASASGPPPPPQMREFESVEQKMYRKVRTCVRWG